MKAIRLDPAKNPAALKRVATFAKLIARAQGYPEPGQGVCCPNPECKSTDAAIVGVAPGYDWRVKLLRCRQCGAEFPSIGWTLQSTAICKASDGALVLQVDHLLGDNNPHVARMLSTLPPGQQAAHRALLDAATDVDETDLVEEVDVDGG